MSQFIVYGYPAGLSDEWAMDFGGLITSWPEAKAVADGLFADARLYGRKLRRVTVIDGLGQMWHERKRRGR